MEFRFVSHILGTVAVFALANTMLGCSLAQPEKKLLRIEVPGRAELLANASYSNRTSGELPFLQPRNANYLSTAPAGITAFTCFALNVTGPDIPVDGRMRCKDPADVIGITGGTIPASGGLIEVMVPSGLNRKLTLMGFSATDGKCPSLDTIFHAFAAEPNGGPTVDALTRPLGSPWLLAETVVEITADTTVTMDVAYDAAFAKELYPSCGNYAVSVSTPAVIDLTDDGVAAKSKTFSWGCSSAGCMYRHAIDQSSDWLAPTGTFSAANSASFGGQTGIYYLHVQARDSYGNTSPVRTMAFTLDNAAPTEPTLLALQDPVASPGNVVSPTIKMTLSAEAGQIVKLYTAPTVNDCVEAHRVGTSVPTSGLIEITSSALADGTYTFRATTEDVLGNVSACSAASVTYQLVTSALTVTGLSNDAVPKKSRTWTWGCSNSPCTYIYAVTASPTWVPTGTFDSSTSLTKNALDGTQYLHVQAKDAAGNVSSLTTVSAVFDNTPPSAPTSLSRINPTASLGNDTTPTIRVTGVTAGDQVGLFTDAACAVQVGTGVAAGSWIDLDSSPLPDGNYNFYAQVIDPASNSSGCSTASVSYAIDTSMVFVSGLSNDPNPTKAKTWSWACNKVCTYSYSIDQSPTGVPAGSFSNTSTATQSTGNGSYYLHIQAKDTAGNVSSVMTVSAILDNTPPSAPSSLSLIAPANNPGALATPTIRVNGVNSGDSVKLYSDSGCTSFLTSEVASGSFIDLTTGALTDGIHTFYAQAVDATGNGSSCSIASLSYTVDTVAPVVQGLSSDGVPVTTKTWTWSCDQPPCTYRYAIDTSPAWTPVGSFTSLATATQSGVTGTYYLHVQAKDLAGNVSAVRTVSALLNSATMPGPFQMTATPNGSSILLSWSPSSGAIKYSVNYKIFGGSYGAATDTFDNYFVVTGLTVGSSYEFTVRATDASSAFRDVVFAATAQNTPMTNMCSVASGTTGYSLFLQNQNTVDLRLAAKLYCNWDGLSPLALNLVIGTGVLIGSQATHLPALSVPAFPTGSRITMLNEGIIQGAGGAGGNAGFDGGPGGTALALGHATQLINQHWIIGGGGGGAGDSTCGGGGGAGTISGPGGSGSTAGQNGTDAAGGTGCGGSGGGRGQDGANSATNFGGLAGAGIVGETNILNGNYNNAGAVYGPILFSPGAIPDYPVGSVINGGVYAGSFNSYDYMTTPGGCINAWTCTGSVDSGVYMWQSSPIPTGATSTQSGYSNTNLLITFGGVPAAQFCADMTFGGYSDWYLPATDELNFIYLNRFAIGGFASSNYWSSTELNSLFAQSGYFSTGWNVASTQKDTYAYVRCVRRF